MKNTIFEEPEYKLVGKEMLTGEEFEGGWIKTIVGAVLSGVSGGVVAAVVADSVPGPAIPGYYASIL